MIPVLTKDDVEPQLNWLELIQALEDGHRLPPAQIEDTLLGQGDNKLLSRAAWIEQLGVGVKSVTVFPANAQAGLPSVQGAMLVFDDTQGAIEAVIDNALITKWKTAGDSLLGARFLARKSARKLLIVGAGTVAASLIEAYGSLIEDLQVTVWARRKEAAEALAARYPGAQVADDLESAVKEAEIISTCTMTKTPILHGAWLQPGQHVDLIGAFTPDMREADDRVLQRGRVFVDSFDTTLPHIGELMIPLASGAITKNDVQGDFRALAEGTAGRQTDDEITVFKNGGGAHLDLMTARYILGKWRGQQA